MKTLIIGANGNLGKEVVKQLSVKTDVKAGVRDAKNFLGQENIEDVIFDFDKPETFAKATENVDKVFVQAPPLDAEAYERLLPFINYLDEKNIKRVAFNSAWGVDHNEEAPLRKIECEFMNKNFDYTITRPNFFIENFTSGFAAAPLQHDSVIVANAGDAKLSFVSTTDIAEIVAKSLTNDEHIKKEYNLSGKEALSHQEVADLFTNKLGKKINYISLSSEEMKAGALENGLPESVADYLVMLYDIAGQGHMQHISSDVQHVLGRAPKTFNDII
ncbi:MAG: NmrA family NAD(P)-binding protein [Algibacter sp.]|uniref:NmrA family NAD(P)-binding protein n=1 Tax=Algibacter sp. TaxID=1872428 RepID=UPI0026020A9E|nr:NmrA family NAD(P)-binding protein [Algibacter sp.]MDG1729424.1 NmrA family NAD(P)-binding protein [Algibacter sp.]